MTDPVQTPIPPSAIPPTPTPVVAVDPSPLPSAPAAVGATGASAVIGYLIALAAAKTNIPMDVIGGALGMLFTGATALWHRAVK